MKFNLRIFLLSLIFLNGVAVTLFPHLSSLMFLRLTTLFILLFLPGLLALFVLQIKFKEKWYVILNSLGLSITIFYLLGLFLATILPRVGITRPLDHFSVLIAYLTSTTILGILAIYRNWGSQFDLIIFKQKFLHASFYFLTISMSGISILGGTYLNNGGNFIISLSWIIITMIIFAVFVLFLNKNYQVYYPFIIFLVSLSLLWSLSSRSNFLTGWDIVQEFLVAERVKEVGKFDIFSIGDAYNACLSINLLPTILSNLTSLPIEFIFKFIYPFIFAHFAINVYLFLKRISNSSLSILAVFYVMAQPFYIQPMVALARQEIAFFFFTLLLINIFDKTNQKKSIYLVVSFIFALVTSHYSTTYISVIIFTLVYSVIFTTKIISFIPLPKLIKKQYLYKNWIEEPSYSLKWWMVILLMSLTIIWYFLITKTAGNIIELLQNTIEDAPHLLFQTQQSQEVQQAIPGKQNVFLTTNEDLDLYQQAHQFGLSNLKPERIHSIINDYPLQPVFETFVLPAINNRFAQPIRQILNYFKDILKFVLILGSLLLVLKTFTKTKQSMDFVLLASFSSLLLMIMIFHPTIGLKYNLSRIYLQLLVFLALPLIICLETLLKIVKPKIRLAIQVLLIFILFFNLQSLFTPIIGGTPVMQFYNKGTDYEKFFVNKGEIEASMWLYKNRATSNTVYGDDFAGLRIKKMGKFFPNTTVIPVVFANNREAYVYLTTANKLLNKTMLTFNGKLINFQFPQKYLNDDRNLIYSNKYSSIYK